MNEHSNKIFERGQIADVGSKGIKVLSLFNGMSTGHTALDNVGIKVNKYYSSELKPYAIELTQYHYPETIQLGDVNNWREWDIDWKSIDLLLSGSPCKDLSGAGKRAGIYGENSGLFWRFVEILEHIKSLNHNVIFLQENVGSASKTDIGIMSRAMGIYPCRINSELVTAQQRDRYYWTNARTKQTMFDTVTDIPQPKDRGILLKDIIENGYVDRDKGRAILESESRLNTDMKKLLRRYKTTGFGNVVYCVAQRGRGSGKGNYTQQYEVNKTQKSNTITLVDKDNAMFNGEQIRPFTKIELCRLQGFPDKEILCIFALCKKEINWFVNAVEKNQELLRIVESVTEKNKEIESLGFVNSAKTNTKQKNPQTKLIVQKSADIQIQEQCKKHKDSTQLKQGLNINANNVAKKILYQDQNTEGGFAAQNAFINITPEKITFFGKGEYQMIDQSYIQQENGKMPLKVYGKEIIQLAKGAKKTSTTTNSHQTSIISYPLNQKIIEQMLTIYYWSAKNAIIGYIHQKTKTKNLYLNVRIVQGHCDILSRNKAASLLGDGWTLPIIEHIFQYLPFKKAWEEKKYKNGG